MAVTSESQAMAATNSTWQQAHALLLPYPETGHINPLMELAKHLASHGILITFVNTQYNHHRILQSNKGRLPSDLGLPIRLVDIPDGLSDSNNRDYDLVILNQIIENVNGPALEHLIHKLASEEDPPITCIISDFTAFQTLDVAKKLGIPRVGFYPPSISMYACACHALYAASVGSFPKNGIPEPHQIVAFPGLPSFTRGRTPWILGNEEQTAGIFRMMQLWLDSLKQSEWVLVNSVHELEITQLPPAGYSPLCPVGPIMPADILEKQGSPTNRVTISLWTEEDACLFWLDAQKPRSVIYVSVRSIAIMSKKQLHELAYGLESTGLSTLWVVRGNITGEKVCALPEEFLMRTHERICVVEWAPQVLVLSHAAIGGFLTHGGWNSTMEAMSMGVPMIVWPHAIDQFITAALVVEKWGVGMELSAEEEGGVVGRAKVESQVKELLQGPEGSRTRAKALEIRQIILKASREGGSSHTNMQRFVNWIKTQHEA